MKRLYQALLCGMLCFPLVVKAQEPIMLSRIKFNGGLKVGANLAKLDGQSWEGGYKTNLLGGAYLRLHNGRWGVQVEGFYSQSEYTTGKDFNGIYKQYISAGKDSLSKGSFKVSYFNIPIMVQAKILSRVWVQIGAQYSGIVSIKDKDAFVADTKKVFDDAGDVSAIGGIWIELPLHLNIGARYVMAFSNARNEHDFQGTASEAWKQRNIQFHLGFKIF